MIILNLMAAGIDHDLTNNLYVTDSGHHRIIKFTREGNVVDDWGGNGLNSGNIQFNNPLGIALDPQGTSVYVADHENSRIQKLTHTDNFVAKWSR